MSSHETLSAASDDRKSRLAHLKNLKRKAPTDHDDSPNDSTPTTQDPSTALTSTASSSSPSSTDITAKYLSGRNYDPETRNARLGFGLGPITDPTLTLEHRASQLALSTLSEAEKEEKESQPLDLFKLQPKKPNWDLKRDLAEKMEVLDVRTENAIARIVRERVEGQKKIAAAGGKGSRTGRGDGGNGEGEEVGMKGAELVEAMHLMEKEGEAERRRDEDVS